MPQVTKTFASRIGGTSVSADGKIVGVTVFWDDGGKSHSSATHLQLRDGKVFSGTESLGPAPAEISQSSAVLAAAAKTLVDSLVSAKKIAP